MQTIIISSTYISESLKPTLFFWMSTLGLTIDIKFTAYNQVIQQLIDPNSLLRQNENGINVVLVRFEDWHDGETVLYRRLVKNIDLFIDVMIAASKQTTSVFLVSVGPFSMQLSESDRRKFDQLEQLLQASFNAQSNVYFIPNDEQVAYYPVHDLYNEFGNTLAHIPYTKEYYTALATLIARKIVAIKHTPYKVIVLDCDQTLWMGVCGEVGPLGIEISYAFKYLQRFMLCQRDQGMLLCLCSKNNEEDVFAVFSKHSEMVLKKEHITAYRINWDLKSDNIRSLAKELNLSLDSFIFIDDNPLECADVRASIPEVLVYQLPEQQSEIQQFLQHVWFFDHLKLSEEDRCRAVAYQHHSKRERYRESVGNMADFLAGLELTVDIKALNVKEDLARVSQLTQRTNQFNVTTIRRSETDILNLMSSGYELWVIRVNDRFGDYGLVGVLIFKIEHQIIHVDTLLLSCRVLGRGVEHAIVSQLGKEALQRNIGFIHFNYVPTKSNTPAFKFLCSITNIGVVNNRFILGSEKASMVEMNSGNNYSEAISTSIKEDKPKQAILQTKSSIEQQLVEITTKNSTVDAIQKIVLDYYLKDRDFINLCNAYISPNSDHEKKLAIIWECALNVSHIGLEDNFFQLGGHSLIAAQIISDIRDVFKVDLDLTDIFNYPSIRGLLERIHASTPSVEMLDSIATNKNTILPLSFAQQRMWFLHQLIDNNAMYNVPVVLHLRGDIQVRCLQKVMDVLLANHEQLRVRMIDDETPCQEIGPTLTAKIKIKYVNLFSAKEQLDIQIDKELSEPFVLNSFPLMRATLFKIKKNDYIFCVVSHHIITDAQSLDVLCNQIAQTYSAIKFKLPVTTPKTKPTYHEFIRWQTNQLQSGKWESQIAYWTTKLADATYLELATDYPHPTKRSYRGARVYSQIDKELFHALKSLAKAERVTLSTVLLGMFQIALYRYTGQHDMIIGMPVSNRHHLNFSNTLGLFVNTLAIRQLIDSNLTYVELLIKLNQTIILAYENQDVPFDKVLESLNIARSVYHHPLFPVMFTHRQKRVLNATWVDVKTEFLTYASPTSAFDLTFLSEESDDDLTLCLEYSVDLFFESTIKNFLSYVIQLIAEISRYPNKKIADLIRFNQKEEIQLLSKWNNTKKTVNESFIIHECFQHHVAKNPDARALVYQNDQLSYQELNKITNQLAHILRNEYAIRPGVVVGIYMAPCHHYIISILAILKAGGAYLPLDPEYPSERLQWMIKDAKPTLLISSIHLSLQCAKLNSNVIQIDEPAWVEKMARAITTNLQNENIPSDVAYIIYTSGSTGTPKGVMVEHRGVCNLAHIQQNDFKITSSSRVLQFSSMCFDASVWEWVMALLNEASLYIISSNIRRDPETLIERCNRYQITHLILPPSMLLLFPDNSLPHVQVLILGGDVSPSALLKKWHNYVPVLINAYGPTEATVLASFHVYRGQRSDVIGRPIANTQFYILDSDRRQVPIGMPGELYIGGIGLARGYLNHHTLTADRFVMTPMGRLYKTGDLARFQSDGAVIFIGREDNQIKIRGHRIELNEIESEITQHADVQQAIVIFKHQAKLIAYVALDNQTTFNEEETSRILTAVRLRLQKKLPNYMLPADYVVLDLELFPLLPNGKIDRKKLACQTHPIFYCKQSYVVALDSVEFALAEIWKSVLNIERVSIDDSFFTIGGNSLLAVSLVIKITNKFYQSVSLDELYSHPTIAELTVLLKSKMHRVLNENADDYLFSKCLLPIQTKGTKPPVFIIHPALGLSLPYIGLGRFFSDQPLYGLSNPYFGQMEMTWSNG